MQSSLGVRVSIIAGCVVALMLGAFVGAYMMLNAATGRVGELTRVFRERAQEADRVRAVKNALAQTKDDRAALDALLIAPDGIVTFIERIEALGRTAGVSVTVDEITVEPSEESPTSDHLVVRFHASGSWQQVSHLLVLAESLPLPVSLSNVRFETSGGKVSVWRGTFSIQARIAHQSS